MKEIVIVGGGTAGWMAAIAISGRFPEKHITVVDPKSGSPIGVGESVTGVVLQFVTDPLHGLSLGEFFRRCDPTFKTGIWYKDWHGPGTEYVSPIDAPPQYFKHSYPSFTEDFYARIVADGATIGEVQLYGLLMRRNLTDYCRNPDGSVNADWAFASCQFDALKFAAWLREVAVQRTNVTHVDGTVERFTQDAANGHLTSIWTREGQEVGGELFLDCTGFHRLLFAKAYQPAWKSYAPWIKVDSALPRFVEYTPGQPIPNYTLARAMPHGWMWEIPTQSRLGRGYIFSSRYVSDEQAVADFRATGVDVGDSPRILRFEPGRFEKMWEGNVCTIGLSGVFSEPLEASTIHGMYVQIRLLTELLLPFCTRESVAAMAAQYNQLTAAAYDDYVDFISYHYRTGRADTDFWRDYQRPEALTPANQAREEKWRHAFPVREDFAPTYTQQAGLTTGLVLWAPMLCALGRLPRSHAARFVALSRHPQMLQENVQRYVHLRNQIVSHALPHGEAIAHLRAKP